MQYIFLCSANERFVKLPILLIDRAQFMLQLIFLPYKSIQDLYTNYLHKNSIV